MKHIRGVPALTVRPDVLKAPNHGHQSQLAVCVLCAGPEARSRASKQAVEWRVATRRAVRMMTGRWGLDWGTVFWTRDRILDWGPATRLGTGYWSGDWTEGLATWCRDFTRPFAWIADLFG